MTSHRVSGAAGAPLKFTFDGKTYTGMEGDTLASALLANGVRIMGRSFKYTARVARGALGSMTPMRA